MSNINHIKIKKKKKDIWKEKVNIFFDILKIDFILIIHKNTSSIIGQKDIHESSFNIELMSRLFQEIIKYEINSKKVDIFDGDLQKDISIFDFKNYKIIVEDGNFIRGALILNSIPSYYLHKNLEIFVKEYEKENEKFLKTFSRKTTIYPDFINIIEKIFDITLVFPHIINLTPLTTNMNPYQDKILTIATNIQKEKGKFFISELLNKLLSIEEINEPKEKIIADIYDLRQYGYIIPIIE